MLYRGWGYKEAGNEGGNMDQLPFGAGLGKSSAQRNVREFQF